MEIPQRFTLKTPNGLCVQHSTQGDWSEAPCDQSDNTILFGGEPVPDLQGYYYIKPVDDECLFYKDRISAIETKPCEYTDNFMWERR